MVAGELAVDVDPESIAGAERVDLHGVIDDQIDRDERVDLARITAERSWSYRQPAVLKPSSQ